LNSAGTQTGRNIYGTNLLMRQADGLSLYYMYNGHADVTALIDATSGKTRATYYYDAFGNIKEQKYYTASGTETTTPINNSIMYAGYQYDKETGLYYLNARMYDPKIARFLQEDTYSGSINDPLSLNLYTYCSNNPLIYFDPTGHLEARISMQFFETNKITAVINGIPITYDPTFEDISDDGKDFFGRKFAQFVYEESNKVQIKHPTYYYNMWDSPDEKVTFWSTLTNGNTWKQVATETFDPIWNFFVDIFTDEDRTDKSMFSYTPETKAKYDEEKIDRWISPGGSIDADLLKESKKAFGEIKDYGVDKGTDEAAKWALGKGFEKAMGPVIGALLGKRSDDGVKAGIEAYDDFVDDAVKAGANEVEDTLILYGKGVTSVPGIRKGKFNKWFNSLTPDELDELWKNQTIRDTIESRLRKPGNLHEWHLVSRTPTFKRMGVTAEQIKDMRTLTRDVKFINPKGIHGGEGSTTAHNELLKIIDSSEDYNMFIRRLQNWADYRLEGGAASLPGSLGRQ